MVVTARLEGRDEELRQLHRCLDRARSGHLALAVVEGEAGIGKSRLLDELVGVARRTGVEICRGAAEDIDAAGPFGPLLAAVGVAGLRRDTAADPMLLPDRRFELLEIIWERLEERARRAPVLLVLDDVHWADPATLLALRILPRRLAGSGVAAVLALRPTPRPAALSRVLGTVEQGHGLQIRLGPLGGSGWRRLQAELLGAEPDEALARWLDGAGGNPFLLVQLVEAALRETAVGRQGNRARLRTNELPRGFRDTARRHLALLAPGTMDLLRVGAVLGVGFTADQLGTVMGVPTAQLVPGLVEAVDAGLLTSTGSGLAFRHDLLREAVYDDLPATVRTDLHLDVARRLAARGAPARTLARHLILGARPGDAAAAGQLRHAAHEVAPGDPGSAADLLLRAFDLAPVTDPVRLQAGAEAVRMLAWGGRLQDAEREAARVLAINADPEVEAQLRLGLVEAMVFRGRSDAVLTQVDAALARPVSPAVRAGLRAAEANARLFVGELTDADAAGREAVAVGEEAGDDHAVCFGLVGLSCVERLRGSLDTALALIERAVAIGGETARCQPGLWHVRALAALDRADEAHSVFGAGRVAAEAAGSTWSLAIWHMFGARLHLQVGRLTDAAAEAETGLALADQWETWTVAPMAIAALIEVAVHRNELGSAQEWSDTGRDVLRRGVVFGAEHLVWAASLLAEARGDRMRAFAELDSVYAGLPERMTVLVEDPCRAARLTGLALGAGDEDRARLAAGAVDRLAVAQRSVPSLRSAALACQGLLHHDAARLEEAVEVAALANRAVGRAGLCEYAAEEHVRAGVPSRAVELLDEAARTYRAAGADRDIARVLASLRRLGAHRRTGAGPSPSRHGLDGLTPTQTAVARLVAEGLTNRAIGTRLYISPHTVDTHLRHIFAKLGLTSRAGLATVIARTDKPSPENA